MPIALLTDSPGHDLLIVGIIVAGAGIFAAGGIALLSTWLSARFYRNHR